MKAKIAFALFVLFISYSAFVYTTATEQYVATMNSDAVDGKMLFQKHNCIACHQIYGLGGYLGPELTTIISERAGDEQYIHSIIKSGSQRMPNFNLGKFQINSIVQYLRYIDNTATTYKKNISIKSNSKK